MRPLRLLPARLIRASRRRGRPLLAGLLWSLAAAGLGAREEALPGLDFGSLVPRPVTVILPPGAVTAATPVLVALDGQNREAWRIGQTIARLAAQGRITPPLVVALGAGPARLDEYGLAGAPDYAGRGRRAAEFQRFVLTRVLPAVRARYGVTAAPAHTGILGSSFGGLAAFDLAWRHPEAFGFAGCFSGSFWYRGDNSTPAAQTSSRLAHQLVRTAPQVPPVRLWFSVGTREEAGDRDHNGITDAVQDTTELIAGLEQRGRPRGPDLCYVEVPGGRHHESSWADTLPGFLEWALPPPR